MRFLCKLTAEMDRKHRRQPKPKLERRNAMKNIEYEPFFSSPALDSSASRSPDLSRSNLEQTSFRIEGVEDGEIERICRSLGLSGPDDFAISSAEWEASKARTQKAEEPRRQEDLVSDFKVRVRVCDELPRTRTEAPAAGTGIKGVRPPVLAAPPSMSLPVFDRACSTWDILRSLAPDSEHEEKSCFRYVDEGSDDEDEEINRMIVGRRIGDSSCSCSFSTSNDDDSSSTTTEGMFVISPNGRFRRNIRSWIRGELIGSGSFGTVYEGFSDDGYFFAIKEVSLLDQGSQAQQCIRQLEQEIALLSQFEHENIVQYLGTDKEEAKLYIFLELVTQGSLASLYQKYRLRDSQVSAYTRQILNGLKYLHERTVVHRDIKCANILVDANGSVKLADFGLAKETSKLDMLKSCKGSAYWMAPEVVNPRTTYGLAADIWSLGCTVLEMLTRQPPYSHLEWTQAIFKIGHGEPPPVPSSLSKDARDFIYQCLQVEPENRPSASDLLNHPFVKKDLPSSAGYAFFNPIKGKT